MAEVKTLLAGLLTLCLVNSCFCNAWDHYIENLTQGPHIDTASIIGLDGSRRTSPNGAQALKMSQAEVDTIAASFNSKDFTNFMRHGVNVSGVRYMFLRVLDDNKVFAKRINHGGIVMVSSKTGVVIAHYPEGSEMNIAGTHVARLAEFLVSAGY